MGDSIDDGLWDSAGEEDEEDNSHFHWIEELVAAGPGSEDQSDDSDDNDNDNDNDDDDDDKQNDNDDDDDDDDDEDELADMPELERQNIIYEREQREQREKEREIALEIQRRREEEKAKEAKKRDADIAFDDEDEDEEDEPIKKRRKADIAFDDEDEDEDEPIIKKKKRMLPEESDEEEEEIRDAEDVEDDDDGVSDISDDQEEEFYEDEEKYDEEMDEKIIGLKEMNQLLLRRKFLYRLVKEPYFEDYVKNKFVRVSIGKNDDQSPIYRVCLVGAITKFKESYSLAGEPTVLGFLLKFGKAERIFAFNALSNSSVIEPEYDKWVAQMKKNRLRIITKDECRKIKKASLEMQQNVVYTPLVVKEMMEKHRTQNMALMNTAFEKSILKEKFLLAKTEGNYDQCKELLERADQIEEFNNKNRRAMHNENDLGLIKINRNAADKNTYLGMKPGWYEYAGRDYTFAGDPFLTKPTRPGGVWLKNPPAKEDVEANDKAFWARKKKEASDNFKQRKHLLLTKGRVGLKSEKEIDNAIKKELDGYIDEKKHEDKDTSIQYSYTFGLVGGVRPSPSQSLYQKCCDLHSSVQLDIDLNPETAKPVHTGLGAVSAGGDMRHTKPPDIETCLTLHEYYERREMGEDNFMT